MSETINLLGGSQTLWGVIATLTILCILNNDGNFIKEMLSLVFERIQKQIKILSKKIKVTPSESAELKLLVRFLSEENQLEYTHILIASHSVIALIVSTLLALLIHLSVSYFPQLEICLFEYDNLMWFKFAILFFALMNGIIFPFLFPCISYMALYEDVKRKVASAEQDIAKMHEKNSEKLKEFCEKIPLR